MKKVQFVLILCLSLLIACESEEERRKKELAHQQAIADIEKREQEERHKKELAHKQAIAEIELQKRRQEMQLEYEKRKKELELAKEQQRQKQRDRSNSIREGIKALKYRFRWSAAIDNTQVLVLINNKSFSVDLNLKCFTRNGDSKMLFVSVPARGLKEVGFLEGWEGNWVRGEKCEAWFEGERLWTIKVK